MSATVSNNVLSRAGTWILELSTSASPTKSAEIADQGGKEGESVFPPDLRCPADEVDYQDNGKYRCKYLSYTHQNLMLILCQAIVKIQARFGDEAKGTSTWMMGTGWLVRPDLLITAGHVVYDWGRRLGPVKEMKCYIGYNGRASVMTSHVQARFAKKVVTTVEWLEKSDNRQKDVAFVQVDRPFTGNLRNFLYTDTHESDTQVLGVVGYPGDKSLKDEVSDDDEAGAQMYEEFASTSYDLKTSRRNMLEYRISTFGGKCSPLSSRCRLHSAYDLGQSGAPIIRKKNRMTAIGTHCYGGGGPDSNSGNAIGGSYGNNYNAFIDIFSAGNKPVTEKREDGISIISTDATIRGRDNLPGVPPDYGNGAEGFFDVLRTVAQIGPAALPIASSLLGGPLGGAIGTAAGAILSSVAGAESFAASSSHGPEGQVNGDSLVPGAAERAVLAEAALQTVLSLEGSPELEQILGHMRSNWESNSPNVDAIASRFQPQLMECALDIMVKKWDYLAAHGTNQQEATIMLERRSLLGTSEPEGSTGRNKEGGDFLEGLLAPTLPISGQEGMFDALGPLLRKAVSYAKPIVSKVAKVALTEYGGKLINKLVGSDQSRDQESLPTTKGVHNEAAKIVFKRALMADAALQALMSCPRADLENLKPKPSSSDGDKQEGVFDFIKTAVQKIAPSVLDTAKSAAKNLLPMLIDAVTQQASLLPPPAKTPTLNRKPSSLMEMLKGPGESNNSIKVSTLPPSSLALEAELEHRQPKWVPLKERRLSLDDNDDLPIVMKRAPDNFRTHY